MSDTTFNIDSIIGFGSLDFAIGQRGRQTPRAKYKIGEAVLITSRFGTFIGEVDGSNWLCGTLIEYAIKGYQFLLWEDELCRL